MKISHEVFLELIRIVSEQFNNFSDLRLWHGLRILGMDGSSLQLPPTPEIWETFQPLTPSSDYANNVPIGRFSCLHDVLNDFTLSATLDPWSTGERDQASRLFKQGLPAQSLILMDRGYPALWLFEQITASGAHFCARMPLGVWKAVDEFAASGENERTVTVNPSSMSRRESRIRNLPGRPLTFRLVRVTLSTGEFEILATSLVNAKQWPCELFGALYHLRWGSEEGYKSYKCVIAIENFSGKSVESVYQDVFAAVLGRNLTILASWEARKQIVHKNQERVKKGLPQFKLNGSNALGVMKTGIVKLFHHGRRTLSEVLERLGKMFTRALELVIPGRSEPRVLKYPKAKYKLNYKPVT